MSANTPSASARATGRMTSNAAHRQPRADKKLMKRQLSGYESSSPEDEEEDETFLALQRLLKALNSTRQSATQVVPVPSAPASEPSATTMPQPISASAPYHSNRLSGVDQQPRLSQEELLESRRQERERFRHMLFSKNTRRRRQNPAYYEEEEDEEPVQSVESTISNRVISGSFSRLNVHVIDRERWSREETDVERLPIVLLPKDGKVVSPAENPKLNVCMTNEHEELREQLMDHLNVLPDEMLDHTRLLTPPQSTWYIQMRGMDSVKC